MDYNLNIDINKFENYDAQSEIKKLEMKNQILQQENESLLKQKSNMKIQFEAYKLLNLKDKSENASLQSKIEELEKELNFTRTKLEENTDINESMTDLNHDINLDMNLRKYSVNNDLNVSFTDTIHTIDNKCSGKKIVN